MILGASGASATNLAGAFATTSVPAGWLGGPSLVTCPIFA